MVPHRNQFVLYSNSFRKFSRSTADFLSRRFDTNVIRLISFMDKAEAKIEFDVNHLRARDTHFSHFDSRDLNADRRFSVRRREWKSKFSRISFASRGDLATDARLQSISSAESAAKYLCDVQVRAALRSPQMVRTGRRNCPARIKSQSRSIYASNEPMIEAKIDCRYFAIP